MAILPHIIFPSDIHAVQARLASAVVGLDQTIDACTSLDAGTRTSAKSFVAGAKIYVTTTIWYGNTTGTFYDRGLDLERELLDWQKKLAGKGCDLKSPAHEPPPPEGDLGAALMWLGIGVTAAAGAYGISKLVPLVAPWLTRRKAA